MAFLHSCNKIKTGILMGTLLLLSSPFALYAQNKHINLTVYHDGTKYKMGFKDSHCPGLVVLKLTPIPLLITRADSGDRNRQTPQGDSDSR